MKILLKDYATGLFLGRGREWTQSPDQARGFRNQFRASAYKVWHRLPRACVVAIPAEPATSRDRRRPDRNKFHEIPQAPSAVVARLELSPGNNVFIRGEGGGLSWSTGQVMQRVDRQTWVWTASRVGGTVVFQLLLNDLIWAKGEDHVLDPGSREEVVPDFEWPEIPRISCSEPPSCSGASRSLATRGV